METFYVDRQFGQAIFIDVEKGIVEKCYNEKPKFNDRMNELYKGKSISFLKEDFEKRMKPIYHNVRSNKIINVMLLINAFKSNIHLNWNLISNFSFMYGDDSTIFKLNKIKLESEIKILESELYDAEQKLITEKERLLTEHNYKV